MSITDLDAELQMINSSINANVALLDDFSDLISKLEKLEKWIRTNTAPKELIENKDAEGNLLFSNQEDFDLYNDKEAVLDEFMSTVGVIKLDIIGLLLRPYGSELIRSLAYDHKKKLSTTLSFDLNDRDDVKKQLVQAMAEYHNITL